MAFLSRVGSILKQSVSKQLTSQISASSPSLYQAFRCMSSSKVFVGGLAYGVDNEHLREHFSQYGEVIEAKVIIDREQERSRGFGFVTYASSEEASSAIQALDGQDFQGRRLRVNYATERSRNTGDGYGGGGGYGGGYGGGGYGGGQNYGGGGGYGGGQNYGGGGGYGGGQNYGSGGYGGGQNYGGGNSGGYGGGGYGGGAPAQQYGGGAPAQQYGGGAPAQQYGGGAPAQQYGGGGGGYGGGGDYGNGGSPGVAAGQGDSFFGGGAAGGNVTAETGFGSSGFEDNSGLSGSDQFGSSPTGAVGNDGGEFESTGPLEETFKDDDDSDNFAKRA